MNVVDWWLHILHDWWFRHDFSWSLWCFQISLFMPYLCHVSVYETLVLLRLWSWCSGNCCFFCRINKNLRRLKLTSPWVNQLRCVKIYFACVCMILAISVDGRLLFNMISIESSREYHVEKTMFQPYQLMAMEWLEGILGKMSRPTADLFRPSLGRLLGSYRRVVFSRPHTRPKSPLSQFGWIWLMRCVFFFWKKMFMPKLLLYRFLCEMYISPDKMCPELFVLYIQFWSRFPIHGSRGA